MKRIRKAIAGVVTPLVTTIVVDQLGGSEQLAVAIAAAITGIAVYAIRNVHRGP